MPPDKPAGKPVEDEPWFLFDGAPHTFAGTTTEIPPEHELRPNRGDHRMREGPAPRRAALIAATVLGLLGLVYCVDLAMSSGKIPRGVTVAGLPVGGMAPTAAEQRLQDQVQPRLTHPITLLAGDAKATIDPQRSGLSVDWAATLKQAGSQPLNPWTRLTSWWRIHPVPVVTTADRPTLTVALKELRTQIDRKPIEGTIRFVGTRPVPVEPQSGQYLDVPAAVDRVLALGIRGGTVEVPVTSQPVRTTHDGIQTALRDIVEPAVSAPVTVTGDGHDAVLTPEAVATALRFTPDSQGGLTVTIDNPTVIAALNPQLEPTQRPAKNAEILIQNGAPMVLPSADGRGIDWAGSLLPLLGVLHNSGAQRTLAASYVTLPPTLSTAQANSLGITTALGTFTTGGFAPDSGHNIRRVAEQVNG
ncbi:MAG: peptidoglycan binding domain-containing protein, partial [Pseudonocardiaceae bacterium]